VSLAIVGICSSPLVVFVVFSPLFRLAVVPPVVEFLFKFRVFFTFFCSSFGISFSSVDHLSDAPPFISDHLFLFGLPARDVLLVGRVGC